MIFESFSSIYKHPRGGKRRRKGLFQPSIVRVKEKILYFSDRIEGLMVGARVISLQKIPQPLVKSILTVERDDEIKEEV